ncbi:DUF6491 family protein [Halioxenophilus sp. WMMB6]|uniref:DUF6491 family protein n=1 Tax=Halioxenophilus sp. WMMB6 TaxID=3073815 RepID=UPI00295E7D4F|nr:DUF6491 family protein [Halioxenophilus sp. WMMB6]
MKIVNHLQHVALALLLAGCAATDSASTNQAPTAMEVAIERGYLLGEEVDKIHNYEISGWQYLAADGLLLPASPSKTYLVLLKDRCSELSSTETIGLTTTVSSVLSRFDAVIVHPHPGGIERRCYIDTIYLVEKPKKGDE